MDYLISCFSLESESTFRFSCLCQGAFWATGTIYNKFLNSSQTSAYDRIINQNTVKYMYSIMMYHEWSVLQ